ncbi:FeoA family protein [Amphritea sp.]|uniref:FeoA family protein n=1 Tax=Amphritea sp. TaxID=1872502 RepID=UPI003A8E4A67
MTLIELKTRQQARIKTIAGPDALRQRLVALGVLKGLKVTVAATSLLGNPRVYSIGKQQICLRSKEASHIEVELQP